MMSGRVVSMLIINMRFPKMDDLSLRVNIFSIWQRIAYLQRSISLESQVEMSREVSCRLSTEELFGNSRTEPQGIFVEWKGKPKVIIAVESSREHRAGSDRIT